MDRTVTRGESIDPRRRVRARISKLNRPLVMAAAITVFVLWAHFGSGLPVFRAHVSHAPGWQEFRASYGLDEFGRDSYFVRAAQNGYNLFYFTHEYGWRFTRKTARDPLHACASCHTVEDLAYAFVNSDRYDATIGKRVSFEERVMRCYAGPMEGFVPTLYDPAVRDIRILARAAAHHLQLSEGARKPGS